MLYDTVINYVTYLIFFTWGCSYGDKPALLIGLVLVMGLNFTSFLPGNSLSLLAGLDLARMRSLIFPAL